MVFKHLKKKKKRIDNRHSSRGIFCGGLIHKYHLSGKPSLVGT